MIKIWSVKDGKFEKSIAGNFLIACQIFFTLLLVRTTDTLIVEKVASWKTREGKELDRGSDVGIG